MNYSVIGALLLSATVTNEALGQRPAAAGKGQGRGYEIAGQLSQAPAGTQVYLRNEADARRRPLDSAATDAAGRFRLRGPLAAPGVYELYSKLSRENLYLPLAPGSRLQVRAAAPQLQATAAVSGAPEAAALAHMQRQQRQAMQRIEALMPRRPAETDTAATRAFERQWAAEFRAFQGAAQRVARGPSYTAPFAAVSFLSSFDEYKPFLDSATVRYVQQWPASPYTQRLLRDQAVARATAVGQLAPDISLPTPQGNAVALSSLRGKYVLMDFWASWCGPCRRENPELLKLYQAYRGKGLELYSVATDDKPEAWRKAIAADGLTWTQVFDDPKAAQPAKETYGIRALPTTILLDPQGRIIAKNMRGEALAAKLADLLP
ncbi:TlpA disulfide reductase family protein [Hymenobacter latericus]|uniref:TlpA disulfide reductase family protein n=1 Tax=Hymenobacter sp. YIM 151858-1 TaxID=2987688 RepID=UPI0022262DB9|nr:TlpA disulfide reductase family protein [Hymenobacter sp. YIM 151858-1]UYZ60029.1 AhpC/TSA family protein [Hymenobacter sp. YIM 151858-1]